MKILCDRHHADLLYSLQRLFEDRLGVEVYVPIGHEWWDEGYWQFGACFGDDRLAQQYLIVHDGIYANIGPYYATFDTAHPERMIRCVTREQFLALTIGPSSWRRCRRIRRGLRASRARSAPATSATSATPGSRWIWGSTPFLINTSEFPVPPGHGVTIHQEIDSQPGGAFAYREPTTATTVRNFVNAFNRLPGYEAFLKVEQAVKDVDVWEFTVHGHEGRDGNINPVSAMGRRWHPQASGGTTSPWVTASGT
jgi:hypothetical protein